MNPIDQLKAVLCDPSGKCCIDGSDEDRAIIDRALQALAQPEQEEPLPLVDIGVDVTPEGTHVVACYNRPDAVQEMFYSQFHPLAKPEQSKYSDIVSDGGLDPRNKFDAQPKQEPVIDKSAAIRIATTLGWTPPRTWVGLTDEEVSEVFGGDIHAEHSGELRFVRAIEAKLKERNQ